MLFQSIQFFIFFLIIYSFYLFLDVKKQNLLLLAASYIFYSFWDYRFLPLLWISTTVDYIVAGKLEDSLNTSTRKKWLYLSLFVNFSILGFFKYFDFFALSCQALLRKMGFSVSIHTLNVILPLGISFYTFQEVGYTIDVYRKELKAERSLINFALFVSYFPHMIAGPIMRAGLLIEQLKKPRVITFERVTSGIWLFGLGYVKKVAVADVVASSVDTVFKNPQGHSSVDLLLGAFLFALQIYCDFSGYSNMASGISRILGVELMVNFKRPYFSQNIAEFWRRWHISLSTWFRDYLYFPLGGNKRDRLITYRNLMIVFLVSGLWHGANWTFVLWGAIHGVAMVVYLALGRFVKLPKSVSVALTFCLVVIAWIPFRASSVSSTVDYFYCLLKNGNQFAWKFSPFTVVFAVILFLLTEIPEALYNEREFYRYFNPVLKGAYIGLVVSLCFLAPEVSNVPFIYFQF